jgi:hypothetical protein
VNHQHFEIFNVARTDAVIVTGHTAHDGALKADAAANTPTFITPTPAVPIVCP